MPQTLFGTPPAISNPDNAEATYSMGTRTTFAALGQIVGIRFWGSTNPLTVVPSASVYSTAGVQLYTEVFPGGLVTAAWNTLMLATPQPITVNPTTRDIVVGPRDRYAANLGTFVVPLVVNQLTGVDGRFTVSAVSPPPHPATSSTTWYGIDVLFDSPVNGVIALPLSQLMMALTGDVDNPAPATGDGSLTISVGAWAQLEAAAQRVLCWAGRPQDVEIRHRLPGLERIYIPETAFGAGPLVLKPGGVNLVAAFLPGEHRFASAGNGDAVEVAPGCVTVGIPGVTSFTAGIGGNPFNAELIYANVPGNGAVNIFWGDGSITMGAAEAGTLNHVFPAEGVYTITIQDATMATDVAVFAVQMP